MRAGLELGQAQLILSGCVKLGKIHGDRALVNTEAKWRLIVAV